VLAVAPAVAVPRAVSKAVVGEGVHRPVPVVAVHGGAVSAARVDGGLHTAAESDAALLLQDDVEDAGPTLGLETGGRIRDHLHALDVGGGEAAQEAGERLA